MTEKYNFKKLIHTEQIYELLKERKLQLELLIEEIERNLVVAPEGKLHVVVNKKTKKPQAQFYRRLESSDKSGVYIKTSEKDLAKSLAQKEYEQKILKAVKTEYKNIDRLLHNVHSGYITDIYSHMSEIKRSLINPILVTDKMYLEQWFNDTYDNKFQEDSKKFLTKANELVRSKSEMIIANLLASYNIPYKYEYPLSDKGKFWAVPDFTALNLRTKEELYWEHLGMLDDPVYLNNALVKISKYEKKGYFPGKELILTFESSTRPIVTSEIEDIIKTYLL